MHQPDLNKALAASRAHIATLQQGHRAVLEFIDKMEQCGQFQDKVGPSATTSHIWEKLLGDIRTFMTVEICALFLVDDDSHEFVIEYVFPEQFGRSCGQEMALQTENGIFSWIIHRRQPAVLPALVVKKGQNILMLPLATLKHTLGIIMLVTPVAESAVTQENLKLLALLAKQFALVMENKLLYERLQQEHENVQQAQNRIARSEKLASIGRLTAGASHELLNPLNILSGRLQLLMLDQDIPSRWYRSLEIMQAQSGRMAAIVNALGDFSKTVATVRNPVAVNAVLQQVLASQEPQFQHTGIRIVRRLGSALPSVRADPEQLQRALHSLLDNAREAMSSGGTLRVSTSCSNGQPPDSEKIRIRIRDSGCGIPARDLGRIFDPFFTTKQACSAGGLGLSICYGIVQDLGGTIGVQSTVSQGTTVSLDLPADISK